MKMKETLSIDDKIALFSNQNVVGFFESLFNDEDPFYDFAYPLCLGYYTVRSANKTISPVYEQAFEMAVEILKYQGVDVSSITEDELRTQTIQFTNYYMGSTIIRPKFIDKWTRIYNTLISEQYDPLKEYEHTEHKGGNNSDTTTYNTQVGKTGDNTDTITYNSQNGRTSNNSDTVTYDTQVGKTGTNSDTTTYDIHADKTGNNSDATTYNTNVEDNGKTGSKEVTTTNREKNADVYGFNSSSPVGDNLETENSTETVVGNADDNTTHNVQQKTGTETKNITLNETDSKTGTETKNITLNETDNKTGTETTDYVVDETVAKTGTDTKNLTISETENKTGTDTKRFVISEDITKSGRNTAGAELVQSELNLRNKAVFFDIIYKDIDSVATIPLYI